MSVIKKQKIKRVYPQGWTGNSLSDLNRLLDDGWSVKFITDMGKGIHDYIIEKECFINDGKDAANGI